MLEAGPHPATAAVADSDQESFRLLQLAARMLLESNVRSSVLHSRIARLAAFLGIPMQVFVAYRSVNLHFPDGRTIHVQTPEYRLNVAISSGALRLVDEVISGRLPPAAAFLQMQTIEHAAQCHRPWLLALLFGLAAAALAAILQADFAAMLITGLASALGLLLRRALGPRHWPLFSLPFLAGALGGVLAGLAVRLGWTQTSGLCLVVPALMLVPGPHLINGLFDLFENHISTGLCRLVLAAGILLAAAAGTLVGGWAAVDLGSFTPATARDIPLTLTVDMALAGLAACGFGAFYNAPWRVLWIAIVCGMIGHGIRFLGLAAGAALPGATLCACLAIGVLASLAVVRLRLPFSSIAFAAAVPMMPGALLYRSLSGALQLSWAGTTAPPAQLTATVVLLLQAALVIGAMAAGLLLGSLAVSWSEAALRPESAAR
jgi:uncharacterized membrane protein YjjP (DUF1212 family)